MPHIPNVRIRSVFATIVLLTLGYLSVTANATRTDGEGAGSIHYTQTDDGRIQLKAEGVTLREVADELSAKTGIAFDIDPRLEASPVSLSLDVADLEELVRSLSGSSAIVFERGPDGAKIVSARITAQLDEVVPDGLAQAGEPAREGEPARRDPWVLANAERPASFWESRKVNALLLQNAWIDTGDTAGQGASLDVPAPWAADPSTENHIVQFNRPVGDADRAAIEATGARVSHYVPHRAFAIKADAAQLEAIRAIDTVHHIEPYHPYFKLSHDIVRSVTGHGDADVEARMERGHFNIVTFAGDEAEADIRARGYTIVSQQPAGDRMVYSVTGEPSEVGAVARLDSVQWVETTPQLKAMNDLANKRVRAKSFKTLLPGVQGEGMIIAVTDSGLDFNHPAFAVNPALPTSTNANTRIVYYDQRPSFTTDGFPGDNDGHGTHVSGSILGNGALSATAVSVPGSGSAPYGSSQFAGVAPKAQIVAIEDFNSFTDNEQASISWTRGARISNNSWGASVYEYGAFSILWDTLVRDAVSDLAGQQELIAFFAAGNDGNGNDDGTGAQAGTIGQPGNAKNVITVGAVELPRRAENLPGALDETDSDWQIASYSSRGPVTETDRRVKPDLVAPGSYVLSVQSKDVNTDELIDPFLPSRDYRAGNVDSGTNYALYSGTSMATPIVAGAGALFYQYYTNTYQAAPSPAMMKAALVAGARMINSLLYRLPSAFVQSNIIYEQGWGLVDVNRSALGPRIQSTDKVTFLDQSENTPVATGQYYTRQVTVQPGQGSLKIVLAWSDPAGTAGNAIQLVNNLDLIVLPPGGGGYLGNRFDIDGVHSYRYPLPDPSIYGDIWNNVEVITIKDPPTGTYSIQVYGSQVPVGPQDFALVIQQGIGIEGRTRGDSPSMALDTNDYPVIAYSAPDEAGYRQVFVKRWIGEAGDRSEIGEWKRLEDQWFGLRKSASDTGVSLSLEDSLDPAVGVSGTNIYVAWEHHGVGNTNIYLRQWNGSQWVELNNSARGNGLSGFATLPGFRPEIAIGNDGFPFVAWIQQTGLGTSKVSVAKWNGSTWAGLANSISNGVGDGRFANRLAITVNSSGNPVVAWEELNTLRVHVWQWNGASWVNLGNQGSAPFAGQPSLAAGPGGDFYLSWIQYPSGFGTNLIPQVFALRRSGVSWLDMGGSSVYPGLSGVTNFGAPVQMQQISYSPQPTPRLMASWIGGTNDAYGIQVRQHLFSGGWTGVGGASNWPGLVRFSGEVTNFAFRSSSKSVPVVAAQLNEVGADEIQVYQQVLDISPPAFAGLQSAVGGTNNNVVLSWQPAIDNFATSIVYRIYRGTSVYNCFDIPMCSTSDVFGTLIATVTNVTTFTVTGMSNYQLRCYGVRAVDSSGFADGNTVMQYAAPRQSGVDCNQVDSDADGMPDWWEFIHFGSITGAAPGADPDADGLTNLQEFQQGTDPLNPDSDGDGLTDGAEVNTHQTNPARADSDGDGLDDGFELALGTDPRLADTNNNGLGDGDIFQLGFNNPAAAVTNFGRLLVETFETTSATRTNWTKVTPNAFLPLNYWHLSTAEPVARTNGIFLITDRSTNTAYRFANDLSSTNPAATYSGGLPVVAAIDSPRVDAAAAVNLFVSWKEFYATEPNTDFMTVQARSAQQTNWVVVSTAISGQNNGWTARMANLSAFAGNTNVQVRFLFTANNINNDFAGWYIDDVVIYQGVTIAGWVRNVNGEAIAGAEVTAIGRGGVTNVVNGHRVVAPGKIFGRAITATDGSYTIAGLPMGSFYVKADEASYRSEFFNGPLFAPSYAFGNQLFAGVFSISDVGANGYVSLLDAGTSTNVHFELELGESRSSLGVALTGAGTNRLPVVVDGRTTRIWNGSTSTPSFVTYQTATNFSIPVNQPDWATNPVVPAYFAALSPGEHQVGVTTNNSRLTRPLVEVREGEFTSVNVVTNNGQGFVYVASLDGISHPIFLNGVPTGSNTPALVKVQAGQHLVSLVPANNKKIAPLMITVPVGGRTNVAFSVAAINTASSSLDIEARDVFGNEITGASVVLNGQIITSNDVEIGAAFTTPMTLEDLRPGIHTLSIYKEGYRQTSTRAITVATGSVGYLQFALRQSDEEYDQVADAAEIAGYTNIFLYDRDDDPDADGLTNYQESELFRNYGLVLNPFSADSDMDGMLDGDEIGYDGFLVNGDHVLYAQSRLSTNAVQYAPTLTMFFRGRYLEGIANFGGTTQFVASINGDRLVATAIAHSSPPVPSDNKVLTILSGIASNTALKSISSGHLADDAVFGDTDPTTVDSDSDGMWDGFEFTFRFLTNVNSQVSQILDPIGAGENEFDPDFDGLNNEREFLGYNNTADIDDWSNPASSDSDGDQMPDGWEYQYGLNPVDPSDAFLDADLDNLPNYLEYLVGSNPLLIDTDADGVSDGDEVLVHGSNPTNPDTDGDNLFDGLEIQLGTNPNAVDTDGDGMPDGFEVLDAFGNLRPEDQRLNPLDPTDADEDYDGDGLTNIEEYFIRDALTGNHPSEYGEFTNAWYNYAPVGWNFSLGRPFAYEFPVWDYYSDPFNADSDGDGMPDGYEAMNGLHPMDPIPLNGNSILTRFPPLSVSGDLDKDGLWNEREFRVRFALDGSASTNSAFGASTSPWNADSDSDGLGDGFEHHALFGNPTLQDTDGDRLMDGTGVPGKFGEVMSERKIDYELVPCPGCDWPTANLTALLTVHPVQTGVNGHLAVITDAEEYNRVVALLTGNETNIAMGFVDTTGDGDIEFSVTGEPFLFHNFATNEPNIVTGAFNFVYLRGDGRYAVGDTNLLYDYVLVEFPATAVSNHYDQATNDLWELVWPFADSISRPYWQRVPISTNGITPPARWGHAMVYNPAFERKARSFNGENTSVDRFTYDSVTVLDNRKLIVIGGADGIDRYSDIWEFSIRSNEWRRSVQSTIVPSTTTPRLQGLHSGVSDFGAVLFMGYFNTRELLDTCPCFNVPWNCDGEAFGEPKNRPWNYGFKDSSYDMTYIIGGWNEQNEYLLPEPMATLTYKSTDDPDPVYELNDVNDDQSAFSAAYGLTVTKYSNNIPTTTESTGIHGFGQLAVDDEQIPVGNFTRTYTAVENPGPERTERTLVITNLAAGIRFARFPFVPNCDTVAYAGLRLDVSRKPLTSTVFTVIAEFDPVVRTSREYSDGGELLIENTVRVEFHHPTTRLNRPFNSTPIDFAFTNYISDAAGGITVPDTNSSTLEIDVTAAVNQLIADGNWRGEAIGFIIIETNGVSDYALIRDNQSRIKANWISSYKQPAHWRIGTRVQTENGEIPSKRKSFGLAYAHLQNRLVLFGGINGNQVFGDTYEANLIQEEDDPDNFEDLDTGLGGPRSLVRFVRWLKVETVGATPSPRWGHSMVYEGERDEENASTGGGRVLLFGGFDANNQPLNDLWEYDVDNNTWTEIVSFQDNERPSPRGGAMMAYYGGEFYKRNAGADYRSTKRRRVVLFGGTDGKDYFNDTWVFYRDYNNFVIPDAVTGNRWTLVDPGGEQSIGPSPRAFGAMVYAQNGGLRPDPAGLGPYGIEPGGRRVPASASVLLFGGRTGTLPKGPDTDKDLVPDGMEHEIGGPAAGRDPRVNALVNPDGVETVPFNIKKLGAYEGALSWLSRSHLADLEAVSYNERNEAWRSELFTWQGWPIETSLDGQSYIISDETQIPFETPYTDRVVFVTGVDALSPDWVNMWYHRHGEGDPNDERDVWELGVPDANTQGAQAAPPYARSGRWVYGTGLRSSYPNNARMELYSPKFDLTLPVTEAFTNDNANSFFLVFHEWLNLADPNDVVRVEVIRPSTPADINTRVTGQDKQTLTLVADRNNSHNTTGDWRRVIVPLNIVGNESNLYVRFTLQSDNDGVAGGWYLDDIAVLQGAEIVGTNLLGGEMVSLLGVNSDIMLTNTMSDANGLYMFGLLPLGQYQVVSGSGVVNPLVLGPGSYNAGANVGVAVIFNLVNFTVNANTVTWDAIVGEDYQVQYCDTLFGSWTDLGAPVTATLAVESVVDPGPVPVMRFYRVVLLNQP